MKEYNVSFNTIKRIVLISSMVGICLVNSALAGYEIMTCQKCSTSTSYLKMCNLGNNVKSYF